MAINTGVNIASMVVCIALKRLNVNAPIWPSFSFASGVVGVAYSQDWDLYPASSPTTYTLEGGSLPTGLGLSDVGNDVGRLSGTPTVVGVFTFTLRASNAYGTADKAFTIEVVAPPPVTLPARVWTY